MESFIDKTNTLMTEKIDNNINQLKSYINDYSILPVLEKAFINDNFIYEKRNGVPNEDFLISNYIADLFLSFQNNKELKEPSNEEVNSIFDACMEIVSSQMTKEILSSTEPGKFSNHNVLFKYTERTTFIPIIEHILNGILEQKYLNHFYKKTGFYLSDISFFRFALTNYIYDRYESHSYNDNILMFTKDDLFSYINEHCLVKYDLNRFDKLIDYFEIKNSDNSDYLYRANNPIEKKPIFKYKNKYICCNPLSLIKKALQIFEEELKKDEKLFSDYGNSKGQKFEELIQQVLSVFFSNSNIYHGLTYYTKDNVKHETDIIVDTGNYLLIVEAKCRVFQEKGKQGNIGSYKRSIKNIIEDAHKQCKETFEYLTENDAADFYDGKDKICFSKKNYLDIFLVTVELENLDAITSDLYETIDVYEKNPILTFSMYDLYMIFDILEKGTLFLIYLDQSRQCLFEKKTHTSTELDYLSTFLVHDLIFDKKYGFDESFDLISFSGLSIDIDNYYLCGKKKPVRKVAVGTNIFLKQINDCDGKIGFTIEKEFLSASIKTQKDVLNKIQKLQKQATKGKSNVLSFILDSNVMGISVISCKNNLYIPNELEINQYIEDKCYEHRMNHWAFIVFTLKPNRIQKLYFE